ncbi:tol-pal system protein YbgF [Phaeobacter inhibens]|uniref:tol-pal system protein YbgF n=1 Tax=Phaeobacter inhibens TaxID=221822 RepID=UPI00076BB069|nr:tol-pal system protein YbgF [Phaeobacter inhibens]KXF89844.1 tol-pal system protein [Phaeobacter inhibens]WHP69204.1 tol-pal system protein YbgF [Phaeobacter inhibens]
MQLRPFAIAALALTLAMPPLMARAQDEQTLADIRQELTVLHVEIQRLKREMSTTGSPQTNVAGDSVLDRVSAIEAELQRLTAQTEQLSYRVDRVVQDGTNRIGDLEFRLVELEGGDISQLGETTTLGGGELPEGGAPALPATPGTAVDTTSELAVGEQADFDAAKAALDSGAYQEAAEKFAAFTKAYPGSPLAAAVEYNRGKALDGLGDTREAARAYLASFSGNATGETAPKALFELGAALGRLGQTSQACVTLAEVGSRFPGVAETAAAEAERAKLACN